MYLKTILLFLLITLTGAKVPKEFSARVIGVVDGDTVKVLYQNKPIHIRLEHIDCPEKGQPYSTTAKQFVSNKIFGKTVKVVNKGKWHWNRLIAEIYFDNHQNINKSLVKKGLAMHFKKYSKSKEYDLLENKAKQLKIGMWSLPNVTTPWQYRKQPN
nr:hypothetical protein BACT7_22360 [Tenacibaculum mesophilum]